MSKPLLSRRLEIAAEPWLEGVIIALKDLFGLPSLSVNQTSCLPTDRSISDIILTPLPSLTESNHSSTDAEKMHLGGNGDNTDLETTTKSFLSDLTRDQDQKDCLTHSTEPLCSCAL